MIGALRIECLNCGAVLDMESKPIGETEVTRIEHGCPGTGENRWTLRLPEGEPWPMGAETRR